MLLRRMPEWEGYAWKPVYTLSTWGKPRENWLATKTNEGPTEIWTRIAGFKVQSANHYTMGPLHAPQGKQLGRWLQCVTCTLFWWSCLGWMKTSLSVLCSAKSITELTLLPIFLRVHVGFEYLPSLQDQNCTHWISDLGHECLYMVSTLKNSIGHVWI